MRALPREVNIPSIPWLNHIRAQYMCFAKRSQYPLYSLAQSYKGTIPVFCQEKSISLYSPAPSYKGTIQRSQYPLSIPWLNHIRAQYMCFAKRRQYPLSIPLPHHIRAQYLCFAKRSQYPLYSLAQSYKGTIHVLCQEKSISPLFPGSII